MTIYALTSAYNGNLDGANFREGSVSREGVSLGPDRRIHAQVARILRYYIANPTDNFGLILGSINNGRQDGLFEIREDGFGEGVVGELTIYWTRKYHRPAR